MPTEADPRNIPNVHFSPFILASQVVDTNSSVQSISTVTLMVCSYKKKQKMTYKVNTKSELKSGAEPDPSGGVNTQSTVRFGSDVDVFTGSSWA